MMPLVAILDFQQIATRLAPWHGTLPDCEIAFIHKPFADEDDTVRHLRGFDVIVTMREQVAFSRSLLLRLDNLKLLVTTGSATCAIDLAAAAELGIVVAGTRSDPSPTVELTWALIHALLRHVPEADKALRTGHWRAPVGRDLAGSTLGIVGLGRIGSRVAAIGRAFGVKLIAWSPHLNDARAKQHGAERVGKSALFERADVVTLHVRLSEETRHLVGEPELSLLGPEGYLINTSRGALVDQAALLEALNSGTIAGAGLDVYEEEPLSRGHPLLTAPRTVLTPHVGYATEGHYRLYYGDVVDDIRAFLDGSPTRPLNNPRVTTEAIVPGLPRHPTSRLS